MKKTLLFGLMTLFFLLTAIPAKADVTCYSPEEASTVDFWLEHLYYAKCTDWEGTGSKLFGENPDYIDFNGGSTIDFPLKVSKDGVYTVTLSYGIGWAHETDGATMLINVNGNFSGQLTVHRLTADPPATIDFEVELFANYDNVIQLKQSVHWPIILGIQLSAKTTGTISAEEDTFRVFSSKGAIEIDRMTGKNQIDIYAVNGKKLHSTVLTSSSFNYGLPEGLYIVKVNGKAKKVIVK